MQTSMSKSQASNNYYYSAGFKLQIREISRHDNCGLVL